MGKDVSRVLVALFALGLWNCSVDRSPVRDKMVATEINYETKDEMDGSKPIIDAAAPGWRYGDELVSQITDDTGVDDDDEWPLQYSCEEPTDDRPGVCPGRGLHNKSVIVQLRPAHANSTIYYTLDGSIPNPENGLLYDRPFKVAGANEAGVVIIRVISVDPNGVGSRVATHTYVFADKVLTQPSHPPTAPARWGSSFRTTAGDYEMDDRVIKSAPVEAEAALAHLPSISIVMDHDDLWDVDKGIYMNPMEEGGDWERPASVEIFSADGSESVQEDCGIRVQGGSSTRNWKSRKLSLRLLFKSEYGAAKLNHQVFADSPVASFDTLVLDAHFNLTFIHPDPFQRELSQYVRDAFVNDLQNAIGSLAPHDRFMHLYLNGLYWGIYDVHERPDDSFTSAYLGGKKSQWDVMKHNDTTVVDGTGDAYQQMLTLVRGDLNNADTYKSLQDYLDIDDFIAYMIVNFYVGNLDWPRQNWYAARRNVANAEGKFSGFRFFSWDAERVIKDLTDDVTDRNYRGSPGEIYHALLARADFRSTFRKRANELLSPGGALYVNPDAPIFNSACPDNNRPAALYMRRIEEIRSSIILESARWGDRYRSEEPYGVSEFEAELTRLLEVYFPQRSAVFEEQLPTP